MQPSLRRYLMQPPERRWSCPNCDLEEVTYEHKPHSRFHTCKGLRGLTAPMVQDGTKAKIEAVERQDYLGKDKGKAQLDPQKQRPVMSVVTTRDDGQDTAVYAPIATGSVKE